jgi:hypothetical protein
LLHLLEHDVELAAHPRQGSLVAEQIGKGDKGDRGERGHRGEKGDPGPPAKEPLIIGWKIDAENFRAVPFGADGKLLAALEIRSLFQALVNQINTSDVVREELERLLPTMMLGQGPSSRRPSFWKKR